MLPLSVRRGRLALAAFLLALPVAAATAQVRAPDRVPRVRRITPERRTELLVGVGRQQNQPDRNAMSTATILTVAYRRQLRTPDWLYVGGRADIGRADVEGAFFPYERATNGDTTRYVAVGQAATWSALWATADFIFPFDDDEKYRSGFNFSIGGYGVLPARSPAPGTGSFFGPALHFGFIGNADITKRLGVDAGIGATYMWGFDRDRLRASDPARGDPVLNTPLGALPDARRNVAAMRFHLGMSYRFGVRRIER